jgi:uncharacterized protein
VAARIAGGVIGVVFGFTLCFSGMSNPAVIREALLFERAYLFLMFASAVLVAVAGLHILRRVQSRAVLTGAPIRWTPERPRRAHIKGSVLFGIGWGVSGACPGPVLTQIGAGVPWAVFIFFGVVAGVWLFLRRGAVESEPASDTAAPAPMARPGELAASA